MAESGFQLISDAFGHGEFIPREHSREGADTPPPLRWTHPPEDARSYVLRVVDPNAPDGEFTHRVLFDIPPESTSLDGDIPERSVQGRNDFEEIGWGGPLPPPKHGDHRYFFTLSALDVETLGLLEGARREDVERAMEGHVLDEATLMGRYRRG